MKRFCGIDWLRGIAAFGIVGCHLNMTPATHGGAAILHFCDMNVGVFGLISGFFTAMGIEKHPGFVDFVAGRMKRILPVYFVWTAAYLVFGAAFDLAVDGALEPKFQTLGFWVMTVFNGGASCHLWYLSSLVYCSIVCAAVFIPLRRRASRFPLSSALSVAALAVSVHYGNFWTYYPVRLFAFMCAGIAIWEVRELLERVPRGITAAVAAVAFCASALFDAWPHHFIPDYLCGIALFVLFLNLNKTDRRGSAIAATSLGVYLIHPVVTAFCGNLIRHKIAGPYGAGIVAADWILAYAISLAFAAVAVRVPGLKRLVE